VRRRPPRRPGDPPDPGTSRCDRGGTCQARNPRADLDRCPGEPRLGRLSRTQLSDEPSACTRRRGSLRSDGATPPWSRRRWSHLKGIAARAGEVSERVHHGCPPKPGGHGDRKYYQGAVHRQDHPRNLETDRTCVRPTWRRGILPASRRRRRARLDIVPRIGRALADSPGCCEFALGEAPGRSDECLPLPG